MWTDFRRRIFQLWNITYSRWRKWNYFQFSHWGIRIVSWKYFIFYYPIIVQHFWHHFNLSWWRCGDNSKSAMFIKNSFHIRSKVRELRICSDLVSSTVLFTSPATRFDDWIRLYKSEKMYSFILRKRILWRNRLLSKVH